MTFVRSVAVFIRIGKGSLAPWQPTKRLVIAGLYRYVRNPMILSVFLILLSESLLLRSPNILVWALIFVFKNQFYFRYWEEPKLHQKFGDNYKQNKDNVPRWIPRLKAWRPIITSLSK